MNAQEARALALKNGLHEKTQNQIEQVNYSIDTAAKLGRTFTDLYCIDGLLTDDAKKHFEGQGYTITRHDNGMRVYNRISW